MKVIMITGITEHPAVEFMHHTIAYHAEIIICDHEITIEPPLPSHVDIELTCRLDALIDYETCYDVEEVVKHPRVNKIGVESGSKAKRIRLPRGRR